MIDNHTSRTYRIILTQWHAWTTDES